MTYKVELTPTDTGFVVECPDLPDCRSQGNDEQEALQNITTVIRSHFSHLRPSAVKPKLVRYISVPDGSELPPFKVQARPLGLPKEWTSHKVEDLLDILEGHDRKW